MLYRTVPLANKFKKPSLVLSDILDTNLDSWRGMLKDWDWDEDDHQSTDINVARMRAKYYGAKYITHRPALQYALRVVADRQPAPNIEQSGPSQTQSRTAYTSPPASPGSSPGFEDPVICLR